MPDPIRLGIHLCVFFRQTARNDWSSVAQQLNTAFDELFNLDLQALTDAKNLK